MRCELELNLAVIPPLSTGAAQASGIGRQGADAAGQARAAAQRAFFQAALSRTQPTAAVTKAETPQPRPNPPAPRANAAPEPTPSDRIARPGSLLNIVV